jgi:hypothetical protein
MLVAAGTELWLGVAAERRALEEVARPLSCIDDDGSHGVAASARRA